MEPTSTRALAQALLDRLVRASLESHEPTLDLALVLRELGETFDSAQPALRYLEKRRWVSLPSFERITVTPQGLRAATDEEMTQDTPRSLSVRPSSTVLPRPTSSVRPTAACLIAQLSPRQAVTVDLRWRCTVGRSDANDLALLDKRASKHHLEIIFTGDKYLVRDLDSANGTLVNGDYVEDARLDHGDTLMVGTTAILFEGPLICPVPEGLPPEDFDLKQLPKDVVRIIEGRRDAVGANQTIAMEASHLQAALDEHRTKMQADKTDAPEAGRVENATRPEPALHEEYPDTIQPRRRREPGSAEDMKTQIGASDIAMELRSRMNGGGAPPLAEALQETANEYDATRQFEAPSFEEYRPADDTHADREPSSRPGSKRPLPWETPMSPAQPVPSEPLDDGAETTAYGALDFPRDDFNPSGAETEDSMFLGTLLALREVVDDPTLVDAIERLLKSPAIRAYLQAVEPR